MNKNGRKRVIISNVQPTVNEGLYAAKTVIHAPITLSADIYADGHDELGAQISLKHLSDKQWRIIPLVLVNNDHWETVFTPDRIGIYEFQVSAWIDHFTSWRKALQKKQMASQDTTVDVQIGVILAKECVKSLAGKDKSKVQDWIQQVEAAATSAEHTLIAADETVVTILSKGRDKNTISTTAVYRIEVDVYKAQFSAWYELFPRSASTEPISHGTFKDVKALLPRINEMGFDVLYMPPIHPIGEMKRKGRNNAPQGMPGDPGSPWAVGSSLGGHKSIHPELGTLRDFKDLITVARKYDIDIAMDIAFQCAPDHPYVSKHPEWFKWRPDGTVQYAENPPKKYEDILPFNFETDAWETLWQELKSIFLYWIEQGVSIFRVDNPHTKAFPFWEWAIKDIKAQHPQVIFLAEAFTRPRIMEHLAKIGFTQSYTYFTWRHTKRDIEEYVTELTTTPMRHYFRPNFWPNTPDILTEELSQSGEAGHIIRAVLAATLSSLWGIYGPLYEYGISDKATNKEEYADSEKYEIKHWEWNKYTKIKEVVSRLNRIRRAHAALQQTNDISFLRSDNEQVIAYLKRDRERKDILIIIVNLDPFRVQQAMVDIPADITTMTNGMQVHDMLSGDRYTWHTGANYVSLSPWDMPAHILKVTL